MISTYLVGSRNTLGTSRRSVAKGGMLLALVPKVALIPKMLLLWSVLIVDTRAVYRSSVQGLKTVDIKS